MSRANHELCHRTDDVTQHRRLAKLGLGDEPGIPNQYDSSSWGWMKARYGTLLYL
jgi:hypothetical protein